MLNRIQTGAGKTGNFPIAKAVINIDNSSFAGYEPALSDQLKNFTVFIPDRIGCWAG